MLIYKLTLFNIITAYYSTFLLKLLWDGNFIIPNSNACLYRNNRIIWVSDLILKVYFKRLQFNFGRQLKLIVFWMNNILIWLSAKAPNVL